jgi:hypothetical protein
VGALCILLWILPFRGAWNVYFDRFSSNSAVIRLLLLLLLLLLFGQHVRACLSARVGVFGLHMAQVLGYSSFVLDSGLSCRYSA